MVVPKLIFWSLQGRIFFGYEYEITVKVGDADLKAEDVYVITKKKKSKKLRC